MASKKRGSRSRATKKAKPKKAARKRAAVVAAKPKVKAKAKAKTKTKAKAKAKAKTKPGSKATARKKPARAVAPPVPPPSTAAAAPPMLEVIEESLVDVSTILRIKDGVARTRTDVDEDELNQFPDPSLVVEAQTRNLRSVEDDDLVVDEADSQLPELFRAEARRQAARVADRPTGAAPRPRDGSLFDVDADGDEGDED